MKLVLGFALISYAIAALAVMVNAASVDAKEMGAVGDGKSDDSSFIQKALDAMAAQGGGTVFLPTGKYRLDQAISVPSGVTLSGVWTTPHLAQNVGGSVLQAYADKGKEDGPALIQLAPSSGVTGVTIHYPEQQLPDVIPYPWTIQGRGMHGNVENVTLVNCYKGIDFATHPNELHYIRNVFGCPLKIGVSIDQCTDIGRVENVHFNPHYWARSQPEIPIDWNALRSYLWNNLVAFEMGLTDWEMFVNTFSFGAKIGYRFHKGVKSLDGCNGSFLAIAADWAQRGILVENCNAFGLLITNGQFVGGEGAAAVVELAPTNKGVVQLSNCSFWGPYEKVVLADGEGSLSLSQCNFVSWDHSNTGVPAIDVISGDLSVQNCRFNQTKKQITLGEKVKSAVITGNQFANSEQIENNSKGDVKTGMNVVSKK